MMGRALLASLLAAVTAAAAAVANPVRPAGAGPAKPGWFDPERLGEEHGGEVDVVVGDDDGRGELRIRLPMP